MWQEYYSSRNLHTALSDIVITPSFFPFFFVPLRRRWNRKKKDPQPYYYAHLPDYVIMRNSESTHTWNNQMTNCSFCFSHYCWRRCRAENSHILHSNQNQRIIIIIVLIISCESKGFQKNFFCEKFKYLEVLSSVKFSWILDFC